MLLAWREVEHAPRMSKKSVRINKSVCLSNKNHSPFYSLWDTNIQSLPMQLKLQIVSQYFQLDMCIHTVSVVAPLHACVTCSADVVLCLYSNHHGISLYYLSVKGSCSAIILLMRGHWSILSFFFKKGWWNKLCMSWGIAGGVRLGIRLVCSVAQYPCSWMYSNSLFISPHLFHWNVHRAVTIILALWLPRAHSNCWGCVLLYIDSASNHDCLWDLWCTPCLQATYK